MANSILPYLAVFLLINNLLLPLGMAFLDWYFYRGTFRSWLMFWLRAWDFVVLAVLVGPVVMGLFALVRKKTRHA